jgi:hypothetical protein
MKDWNDENDRCAPKTLEYSRGELKEKKLRVAVRVEK